MPSMSVTHTDWSIWSGVTSSSGLTVSITSLLLFSASFAICSTCAGNVAEKSAPCLFAGGGIAFRIFRIASRKPMSSSWSASSRQTMARFSRRGLKPLVLSKWSCKRPGVATRMSIGLRASSPWSPLMLVPPKKHAEPNCGWYLSRSLASSEIWEASSRVGESTMAPTAPPTPPGRPRISSMMGTRKASVLPVPVRARARTSCLASIGPMVAACTMVMSS
mmetsp:Transcript_20660/g.52706  ORF Transcript_20660/g.52706 Transcript_20660/m.52706 type:complete len:220 (-) Transcript_20660:961-1620(-)